MYVEYHDERSQAVAGTISNHKLFLKPHPSKPKGKATVNLSSLKPGNYKVVLCEIGDHKNDSYSRYLEMGSPTDRSQGRCGIKVSSSGGPSEEHDVIVNKSGTFTITKPLAGNRVILLSVAKQ